MKYLVGKGHHQETHVVIAAPPRHKLPSVQYCTMRCTEFSKRNWLPRERLQVRTQICGGRPEIACQNCRGPPESEIPRVLVTGEGKVCEALPQRHLSTKTPTLYLQSIPIGEKFYLAENFYWGGHLLLADLLVFLLLCRSLQQKVFHR